MKHSSITLLILICLFLNVFTAPPVFAVTLFKEGIYKLSDLNISQSSDYTVQNNSPDKSSYIIIFDENQHEVQSIHLPPKSISYSLLPLQPNYRIAIVGDGEVTIN